MTVLIVTQSSLGIAKRWTKVRQSLLLCSDIGQEPVGKTGARGKNEWDSSVFPRVNTCTYTNKMNTCTTLKIVLNWTGGMSSISTEPSWNSMHSTQIAESHGRLSEQRVEVTGS
jgi:hypothetical protein